MLTEQRIREIIREELDQRSKAERPDQPLTAGQVRKVYAIMRQHGCPKDVMRGYVQALSGGRAHKETELSQLHMDGLLELLEAYEGSPSDAAR